MTGILYQLHVPTTIKASPKAIFLLCLPLAAQGATMIDYTAPGVAYGVNGATIYTLAPPYSSSGSGTFGGYLKVLGNTPVITGISTDSATVMTDVSASQTSALPYATLADGTHNVTINGTGNYLSFGLDLNEPANADSFVSIDVVNIYHSSVSTLTASSLSNFLTGNGSNAPTLVWSMDAGSEGDVTLLVDATLTAGSGQANMGFAIPSSVFSNFTSGYFYIYYSEGSAGVLNGNDYGNAGGFEEFGLISGQGNINTSLMTDVTPVTIPVPEPSTAVLGGLGVLALLRRRRA